MSTNGTMYQFKKKFFPAMRTFFIAIVFLKLACQADVDPCINGNVLHGIEKRYTNYTTHGGERDICDKYGIPEGGQWYTIHHNMPTKPPPLFKCGTKFPVWLNGSIPSLDVGIVERNACQVGPLNDCQLVYRIKIKNCIEYFVYFLKPTDYCPTAYCFGDGNYGGTSPDFRTSPKVRASLTGIEKDSSRKVDSLVFSCEFEPSTKEDENLLYFVEWVTDEKVLWISPSVTESELEFTNLQEIFLTKLNIEITCRVCSRYNEFGDPGPMSSSERFFAGVQVDTNHLYIPVSGAANIFFRFTVPFGCTWDKEGGVFEKVDCNMHIDMSIPDDGDNNRCFGEPEVLKCSMQINSSQWSKQHSLTVKWKDGEYYESKPSIIALKTNILDHHLWNILFPPIKVTPIQQQQWKGKMCRARTDPQHYTFNYRYYQNQNDGTFLLYRHQDKDTPMEVQYKSYLCNWSGSGYCICAVAVRAGGDLFVIDRCDDEYSIANFITCGDKILDARKERNNERKFNIFFPSGTEVQIEVNGKTLNIGIASSANDWEKTEGLCGFMSDEMEKDFRLRNGSFISVDLHDLHPDVFSLSWRVPTDEDLFEVKENEDIGRWDSNDTYCVCPASGSNVTEVVCSFESRVTCVRDRYEDKVDCKIHLGNLPSEGKRRKKRSAVQQAYFVNMTKQEAEKYCRDFMLESRAFNACASVPNVLTAGAIDICVSDIQLTSTLGWVNQTLGNVKADCMGELRRNYTLQVEGDDGSPSVGESIINLLCPGHPECSKRGQCTNGRCICEEGFISPDCSVDITDPPEIYGLRGDGLCYTYERACNTVYFVGVDIYKSVNLSCSVTGIKTNSRGETHFLEESPLITAGHHDTIAEAWCQLPNRMFKGDNSPADIFIYGYEIKMSYDKINFGEPFTFYIIESPCIDATTTLEDTTFRITEGMCLISGECYLDGTRSKTNSCSVCDPRMSQSDWSPVEGCPVKPLVVDYSDDTPNLIALIIGISVFVLISIVVILLILRYLRSKKGKWDVAKVVYQQKKI